MTAPAPARLRVDGHCLIVLERTLRATHPLEGCALLLGEQQGDTLRLQRIWPCCNSWQPETERTHRFQLDPREQLLAQRWARQRELQVLGAAHSHPSSAASPSPTDLKLCLGPCLMLIHSGMPQSERPWGAWWIADATPDEGSLQGSGTAPLELILEIALDQRAEDLGE